MKTFAMAMTVALGLPLFAADYGLGIDPNRLLDLSIVSHQFNIALTIHGEKWQKMWNVEAVGRQPHEPFTGGKSPLSVTLEGQTLFEGVVMAKEDGQGGVSLSYSLHAQTNATVETISLQTSIQSNFLGGIRFFADGAEVTNGVQSATCRRIRLLGQNGKFVELETDDSFAFAVIEPPGEKGVGMVRLCRAGRTAVKAGDDYSFSVVMRTETPLKNLATPWSAQAGEDFIPLSLANEIEAGSILDFTGLVPRKPCGTYGRLRATAEGHFEFERLPGVKQRLYGINLHSNAICHSPDGARRLANRLVRLGYNSVRFHNVENESNGLLRNSPDEATPPAENFVPMDNMMAACRECGLYVTIDMYVGWRPTWRSIGYDRNGRVDCGEWADKTSFKFEVLTNSLARAHFKTFVRHYLNHVNPQTGLRYGDDPTLALLSVVNESSCEWTGAAHTNDLCRLETAFMKDMRHYIHEELGFRDLPLTSNNSGTPFCLQYSRAADYDYCDMHCYFDHPRLPKNATRHKWGMMPIYTANARLFARHAEIPSAVAGTRIWGKPLVVTEFNWCGPSIYRGAAGLLFGAIGAAQDWDGYWRYLWSHSSERALNSGKYPIHFLEQASDPFAQASERAAMCLFLRGDFKPLERCYTLVMPAGAIDPEVPHKYTSHYNLPSLGAGWYARFGCAVGTEPPKESRFNIMFPDELSKYSQADAEAKLGAGTRPCGDGQVWIDRARNAFAVTTPRTCGGTVEQGEFVAGPLVADCGKRITSLWISAMDDQPLATSKRILLQHLTDMFNTNDQFADRDGRYLLDIGEPPYLVPRAKAQVSFASAHADQLEVWAVDTAGRRTRRISSETVDGCLKFTCDPAIIESNATIAYEIMAK